MIRMQLNFHKENYHSNKNLHYKASQMLPRFSNILASFIFIPLEDKENDIPPEPTLTQ